VGRALKQLWRPEGRRIGLVGLGTGSLAAYGEDDDYMRIYEINPEVERLARSRFTYLDVTSATVEVVMGDARVSMEHELQAGQPQRFDLLALDAFSSDAIPVHLLTAEAFGVYLEHLKPDGVIAVHVSNRYLDLEPVVRDLAEHHGMRAVLIADDAEEEWWNYRTSWMLITRNEDFLELPEIGEVVSAPEIDEKRRRLWTDDYASLFDVLK
jgi:spermidine synthase